MKPVDWVIVGIFGVAFGHNIIAAGRGRQLISERVDEYRAATPVADAALTLLWLHLTRRLPRRADPFNTVAVVAERVFELLPGAVERGWATANRRRAGRREEMNRGT